MHTMTCTDNKTIFTFDTEDEAFLNYMACGRLGLNATLFGKVVTIYHKRSK